MAKKLSLSKKTKTASTNTKRIDSLYARISSYIEDARHNVQRTIDTEIVKAYWLIGQEIVEEEQHGKKRAEYGSFLLQMLSERLTIQYGRGFGLSTLRDIRQFYLSYSHISIHHALRGESSSEFSPNLGWIHYRTLMRVHRLEARRFYTLETEKIVGVGVSLKDKLTVYSLID